MITGVIRGTSKEKLYQELGFEYLKQPALLYDLISPLQRLSRNKGCIYGLFYRTVSFKNSFLPYAIKEWNKLDPDIRNAKTYASF